MHDQSVERVSRSCVTLEPRPITTEEIQEITRPVTDEELGSDKTKVDVKVNDLPRRIDDDKEDVELGRSSGLSERNNKNKN